MVEGWAGPCQLSDETRRAVRLRYDDRRFGLSAAAFVALGKTNGGGPLSPPLHRALVQAAKKSDGNVLSAREWKQTDGWLALRAAFYSFIESWVLPQFGVDLLVQATSSRAQVPGPGPDPSHGHGRYSQPRPPRGSRFFASSCLAPSRRASHIAMRTTTTIARNSTFGCRLPTCLAPTRCGSSRRPARPTSRLSRWPPARCVSVRRSALPTPSRPTATPPNLLPGPTHPPRA